MSGKVLELLPHGLHLYPIFHSLRDLAAADIRHFEVIIVHHDKADKEQAAENHAEAEGAGRFFVLPVSVNAVVGTAVSWMDNYDLKVADVSSSQITEAVKDGADVQAVWQELQSFAGQEDAP